jgi:phage-related protein
MGRKHRFEPVRGTLIRITNRSRPKGSRAHAGLPLDSCQIWHILATPRGEDKPLVWLHGEIKTPPMSSDARVQAGFLLRRLQGGELLSMPDSRPMPSIGIRCYELRIDDGRVTWRVFYRIDTDAIVILEVLKKQTQATPKAVLDVCKRRLAEYDSLK